MLWVSTFSCSTMPIERRLPTRASCVERITAHRQSDQRQSVSMAARPGRRRQAIASRGSSAPGRVTPLGGAAVASFEASNEGAWCSCVWTVNRMTCGNGLGVACVADDENSRNASLAVEALACHGAEEAVTIARGVVRTFYTSSSRPLPGTGRTASGRHARPLPCRSAHGRPRAYGPPAMRRQREAGDVE
jgi:hypothetical protein